MAKHPNKHIREAIRYAEDRGWTLQKAGPRSHSFGKLICPHRGRDGHQFPIYSTPRNPENHSRLIIRRVNACHHTR